MKRILMVTGLMATLVFAVGTGTHLAQGPAAKEPDFNERVASSPANLRNGVATREQVDGFLGVDDSELHGEKVWEITEIDLDQDGVKDLMISSALNEGPAGFYYSVFIGSPKGFRFVGDFQGEIRTLPVEKGKPVRFIIVGNAAENKMSVELAELQATGLHRLAKAEMTTNGCDANDNPAFTELFCGKTVSSETLKKVFGAKAN